MLKIKNNGEKIEIYPITAYMTVTNEGNKIIKRHPVKIMKSSFWLEDRLNRMKLEYNKFIP